MGSPFYFTEGNKRLSHGDLSGREGGVGGKSFTPRRQEDATAQRLPLSSLTFPPAAKRGKSRRMISMPRRQYLPVGTRP
jgi:hypothetical protein